MDSLPGWLWIGIACAVTGTWVVLNVIDAVSGTYAVSPLVHGVMGSIVGAAGATGYRKERRGD